MSARRNKFLESCRGISFWRVIFREKSARKANKKAKEKGGKKQQIKVRWALYWLLGGGERAAESLPSTREEKLMKLLARVASVEWSRHAKLFRF